MSDTTAPAPVAAAPVLTYGTVYDVLQVLRDAGHTVDTVELMVALVRVIDGGRS